MRTRPSFSPSRPTEETAQERLLRDALHERAEKNVEVEQAWMQAAQRLPELRRRLKPAGHFHFPFRFYREQPRKAHVRRLKIAATLALVAVLLMGAGVATGITSSWGSIWQGLLSALRPQVPASQFEQIGQQQQSNGITITLESVYASTDRTILGLMIQLSPDLSKDNRSALTQSFDFVVNGQEETLSGQQQAQCLFNFGKDHSEYCIWELAPLRVSASAKNVDVTWDFTSVMLQPRSSSVKVAMVKYSGHWSFHFTAPFHRQNHDPGLPPTPAN